MQVTLAALTCLAHTPAVPATFLQQTAVKLLHVALGAAPSRASCTALQLLSRALGSIHATIWVEALGPAAVCISR